MPYRRSCAATFMLSGHGDLLPGLPLAPLPPPTLPSHGLLGRLGIEHFIRRHRKVAAAATPLFVPHVQVNLPVVGRLPVGVDDLVYSWLVVQLVQGVPFRLAVACGPYHPQKQR